MKYILEFLLIWLYTAFCMIAGVAFMFYHLPSLTDCKRENMVECEYRAVPVEPVK